MFFLWCVAINSDRLCRCATANEEWHARTEHMGLHKNKKRKGLGGGGLTLLQHYCPFCFKGRIGVSNGVQVSKGSPLIDATQALHAAKGNGLCPLDLKAPGEPCENQALCRLTCLVCGQSMVEGTEPEFDTFMTLFCGDDEGEKGAEVTLKYEVRDAMDALGLVWVEGWDTPVHARCAKKTVCKCVVPIGCTFCPAHQRSLLPRSSKPQQVEEGRKQEPMPTISPPEQTPTPVASRQTPLAPVTGVGRATWLAQPTATTRAGAAPAPPAQMASCKRQRLQAPPPKKATLKNAQMEAAAKTCAFTLQSRWAVQGAAADVAGQKQQQQGFSLSKHYKAFDTELHGYRIVNGVWGYRRAPDGKFIPTASGVNVLHEDGTMSPG